MLSSAIRGMAGSVAEGANEGAGIRPIGLEGGARAGKIASVRLFLLLVFLLARGSTSISLILLMKKNLEQ